jgi:hypothetical protein
VARPSKITPEIVEAVERGLAQGATIPAVAAEVGVSERTINAWLADGIVARRRLRSVDTPAVDEPGAFTDEAIESAMVDAIMRAAAHDWRAARFILQARWPGRWGEL